MKLNTDTTNHQHTTARLANKCLASCRKVIAQIEKTKTRILSDFRGALQEHEHLLELAVNEAEALAWQTGFPQLLFPTLAEENARAVAVWHARQHDLLRHGPGNLVPH